VSRAVGILSSWVRFWTDSFQSDPLNASAINLTCTTSYMLWYSSGNGSKVSCWMNLIFFSQVPGKRTVERSKPSYCRGGALPETTSLSWLESSSSQIL
jgi:hypothetical protein